MDKNSRRKFIQKGIIGGAASMFAGPVFARAPTPNEAEGPFYPVIAQKDKDFDLTRVNGSHTVAQGKVINILGKVLDTDNLPVEGATVDLWQANAAGRYTHPHDTNKAPLDPDFQGWAIVATGKNGTFQFKTIFPGSYPASSTWVRPPHIHFKISKIGYIEVITQMYFPAHPLNNSDLLLRRKSQAEQQLMIASKISSEPEQYEYTIIIEKA